MNLLKGCVLYVAHRRKGGTFIQAKWLPGHRWQTRKWESKVLERYTKDRKRYAIVSSPLPPHTIDLGSELVVGDTKCQIVAVNMKRGHLTIENPPARKRVLEASLETLWNECEIVNPYDAMIAHGIEFRGGVA